jgi:two-component system, NtrC family, nitrogen regulation sensor histidine kinase NtrY
VTFRTKVLAIFLFTVVASVAVVGWGVMYYTQRAFEDIDAQRTEALVAQFRKEFVQRGEDVVRRVEGIADAEVTLRMAIALAQPNADLSLYVRDATGAAQEHGLDFAEFVNYDGTLISSVQYPARVGYKNDWVLLEKDWPAQGAFLKREELPDNVALSVTAVRTVPVGEKTIYVVGGQRLDEKFLSSLVLPVGMRALLYRNLEPDFVASSLTGPAGEVTQADRFAPLIKRMQKDRAPFVDTIEWSSDPADSETFHALPLSGRNNDLLGVLLVGSPRGELVLLTRRIERMALAVGAAGVFLGFLFAWWVSARVTRPVERLAEGARDVAAGHWDTRVEVSSSDEVGQLAVAFNDMTRQLAGQRERLLQAERVAAWRELARRLAHELRNPLFPLQITVENLQRARGLAGDQFDEVFAESTATLKAELANLNTIVGRFSDFSKMPAPQFERVNLNEAVRNAVRLFEPQFSAVGRPSITPEYYLAENLPEIQADPDLLHRALQNLVLNSLDAMPGGGTLTVRTQALEAGARLEISDTGKGLTPEECSRLFTPYYTTKQHGTGLGLAIVQSVVSDHGGTISVSSEPERGTTFRIDFRLRQTGARAASATETPGTEQTPAPGSSTPGGSAATD